jgi:hypothetical protein
MRRRIASNDGSGWHMQKDYLGKDGKGVRHQAAAKGIWVPALPMDRNELPVQFSIIVPSTEMDRTVSATAFRRRIMREKEWLDSRFGGDTSVATLGSYWDGSKVIRERGARLETSMTVERYKAMRRTLAEHVREMRSRWKQQSVMARLEGVDYIHPKQGFPTLKTAVRIDEVQVT